MRKERDGSRPKAVTHSQKIIYIYIYTYIYVCVVFLVSGAKPLGIRGEASGVWGRASDVWGKASGVGA